jgi:plastocyanin
MASMPGMTMSAAGGQGSGAAGAAPVAANTVAIKNFAFAPAAITVKAGTKVTWTNQDSDAHTVTSQNNSGPLSSAALNTGQSYSYTFTKPGTYSYLCTIHPFMTATVTVTP